MKKNTNQVTNAEEEASIMLNHAVSLSRAASSGTDREKIQALDSNLKLWVEIETTLKNAKNLLPQEIKDNLMKLSKFVERLTLSKGIHMSKSDYDTLVNINMQISEGLVQAVKHSFANIRRLGTSCQAFISERRSLFIIEMRHRLVLSQRKQQHGRTSQRTG